MAFSVLISTTDLEAALCYLWTTTPTEESVSLTLPQLRSAGHVIFEVALFGVVLRAKGIRGNPGSDYAQVGVLPGPKLHPSLLLASSGAASPAAGGDIGEAT